MPTNWKSQHYLKHFDSFVRFWPIFGFSGLGTTITLFWGAVLIDGTLW